MNSCGKNSIRRKRGVVLLFVAICLMLLVGFVAMAVDVGYLYVIKARLQTTADAAATAAVTQLPDTDAVLALAQEYAGKNMLSGVHGTVLAGSDVVIGNWDPETQNFTPGLDPLNAVRVITRRAEANGNPVQLFFGGALGFNQSDAAATSIAAASGASSDCFNEGIIAGGQVIIGQDAILNGACIYGGDGVSLGQDTVISDDSTIAAPGVEMLEWGQGSQVVPGGDPLSEDNVLAELEMQPELALDVQLIIDDLLSGAYWPPQITQVVDMGQATNMLDPALIVSGTAYVFQESVSIDQFYEIEDVFIATRKNISFGQNAGIINTGDPSLGAYSLGLLAGENIAVGQNSTLTGVDLISGKDVVIGQDTQDISVTIEAVGNVTLGQDTLVFSDFGGSFPDLGGGGELLIGGATLVW